jgi:hypothetical protein
MILIEQIPSLRNWHSAVFILLNYSNPASAVAGEKVVGMENAGTIQLHTTGGDERGG